MVIEELKNKLEYTIKKYGINSIQAYNMSIMLSIEIDKKYNKDTIQSYYSNSFNGLTEYIRENEMNPSEVRWNRYAIINDYLSSKTMGYIYGNGFNKLCKEIRKGLKDIIKF